MGNLEKGRRRIKNASYTFKPSGYFNGGNLDNDFSYIANFIDRYDNRTFNRNFADRDFDSGTDFDFYPENSCRVPVHSSIIAVDKPENAGNDARDFRTA